MATSVQYAHAGMACAYCAAVVPGGLERPAVTEGLEPLRTIRVDLLRAFADGVALIAAAALGLLDPPLAGAATALGSVFAASRSLRLRSSAPSRHGASGA